MIKLKILSTVDRRPELLRKRKERLQRVKKGLMSELLTGKRRVRL
jgi:type I restriction enzyme S subunit